MRIKDTKGDLLDSKLRPEIPIFSDSCKNSLFTFRYGSATYKAPVATVLDPNGKLCVTLTYGKLLSRSHKIAYTLLNKALSRGGDCCLKPGDRIALVYPNNDPISFMCAFYGCLHAGIVPVPIEVPLTRRDAGSQQIGFLLGSCGIQVSGAPSLALFSNRHSFLYLQLAVQCCNLHCNLMHT